MVQKTKKKVLKILIITWFVAAPLFWRLDLSKGTLGYYDTFSMAPYAVFHAAVFYVLMSVSVYFERYSLFNIFLLTSYHPVIILANYPYLTFRDVYLHGAPARTILADGHLNYTRNQEPEFWPSSFTFDALSTTVLGCDLVVANYILYISLIVALALIMFCIAKKLENRGYTWAWISPIMFLALFGNQTFSFNHYARDTHAFILLFLFFLTFIFLKGRSGSLAQLLVIMSLVTMHPFQSFYIALFLLSYIALSIIRRSAHSLERSSIALFSIVAFFGWFLYEAYPHLERGLQHMIQVTFSTRFTEQLTTAPYVLESIPVWGEVARSYYKYSLAALISIGLIATVMIIMSRKRASQIPHIITSFMSFFIVSVLFIFIMAALPGWSLSRASAFLAFPAAFWPVIGLSHIAKRKKVPLNKKLLTVATLVFITSLAFTTTILQFEGNQYFAELEHPSEFSSLSFVATHIQPPANITADWRTRIYASYFLYNTTHQLLQYLSTGSVTLYARDRNQTEILYSLAYTVDLSDFLIRGIRDRLMLGNQFSEDSSEILVKLDEWLMAPGFNNIYSNGYYSIFSKNVTR
jgi:hypothetical protein